MPAANCEAVILRRRRFSETSWTLAAFSREMGRLDLLAKGARRPASPLHGHLDLYSRESLLVYGRGGGGLSVLAESHILDEHAALRRVPAAFAAAGLLAEAVRGGFAPHDPHPAAYAALAEGLSRLAGLAAGADGAAGAEDAGLRAALAQSAADSMEALLRAMGYAPPKAPAGGGGRGAGSGGGGGAGSFRTSLARLRRLANALERATGRRPGGMEVFQQLTVDG